VKAFPPGTSWDHGIMMAEGDYVMVHSRYSLPDGSALIVVDIMRIQDGLFQEHWDVSELARTEAESKSKRPMFGDKFPVRGAADSIGKDAW
jgi:predicted SnoaL-like aldol condensation-catalyzing enzyme